MSDDSKEWRWVGEDGAQKTLSEQELIAELTSESLAHYTLVWKKGWAEWLPAMQVVELAWALPPGKADDPVAPKERPSATAPPAPPLYRYPVIKRRAQNLKSDKPPPERPIRIPRPGEASGAGAATGADEAAAPEAKPVESDRPDPLAPPAEAPLPTKSEAPPPSEPLDSEDFLSSPSEPAEATVEPDDEILEVDAQLEESRPHATEDFAAIHAATAAYAYGDEDNAETRVLPGRALPSGEATYVAPHAPPPPEASSLSEHPPAFDAPISASQPPMHDGEMQDLPRLPPPPAAPAGFSEYAAPPRTGPPPYVYGLVGVIIVLGLILVFKDDSSEEVVEPLASTGSATSAASAASAPAAPPTQPPVVCSVSGSAIRLAPEAFPGVPPAFAPVPNSTRLAIGFADAKEALGITVDPSTLDRDQVFRQSKRSQVVTSTPTTAGDRLAFQVVRDQDDVSPAAVVNVSPPFVIGLYKETIARRPVDSTDKPSSVWDDVGTSVTTPRVETVEGTGHALTLRVGGKDGTIRAGWLTRDGARLSELTAVGTNAEFVGTPNVGGNASGALVTFAARRPGDQNWGVQLARMPRGQGPAAATWFTIPEGGPGGSAISPLAAGLGPKKWLLAWTEGSAGAREVRIQVLDENAEPAGPATRVSPAGTNAGQGALWVHGRDVVVTFFVEGDKQHELWGAAVHCPEGK